MNQLIHYKSIAQREKATGQALESIGTMFCGLRAAIFFKAFNRGGFFLLTPASPLPEDTKVNTHVYRLGHGVGR